MKTALVFPNWAGTEDYRKKTAKFLEYYSQPEVMEALGLESTKDIWIVDNASGDHIYEIRSLLFKEGGMLMHPDDFSWKLYQKHYDRPKHMDYKYCWRALYFGRELFQEYDYDKVIHLNNDSFVLSKKIANHIVSIKDGEGWMPWCPKHSFPECDINVYTKNFEGYWNLTAKPYGSWVPQAMENVLRSHSWKVEKEWIGDRYSEYPIEIPKDADFATQVNLSQKVKFNG